MLTLPPSLRVFLALTPVDMRGSFDALAGHVRLYFDRSGWCLFQKRLERGTFQLPVVPAGTDRLRLDPSALASLLEGIELTAPRRRWYQRDPAPRS